MHITTLKKAQELSGKVTSRNSKMPGSSYPTDPFSCKVGEVLSDVESTPCYKCYARKIASFRPSVRSGWARNQEKMVNTPIAEWVSGVVFQIKREAEKS